MEKKSKIVYKKLIIKYNFSKTKIKYILLAKLIKKKIINWI